MNNLYIEKLPLVSIVVVTYNSAKYVLDVLECIKEQTYANIELIISDDASQDETLDVCKNWIEHNRDRFKFFQLLCSSQNTGTAGNINRGIGVVHGDWIKLMAADDIIYPDYLTKVIHYILDSQGLIKILYTNLSIFNDSPFHDTQIGIPSQGTYFTSNMITAQEQNQVLLRFNPIFAVGLILSRDIFRIVNNYDERFPLCEDWFFWFRVTRQNIKIYYYNINGVGYRKHIDSVQKKRKDVFLSRYELDKQKGISEMFLQEYPFIERILVRWMLCVDMKLYIFFKNKRNRKILFLKFLLCCIPDLFLKIIRYKYYKMISPL